MSKISIIFTQTNGKRYAVFKVNSMFASESFWAGYHDLPRHETRVEMRPGDEEIIIAEVKRKVVEAEAAIAKHEEFIQSPAETHTLEVAGHCVTVHIKPWYYFSWRVEVSIPRAMREEIDVPALLGENFVDGEGEN